MHSKRAKLLFIVCLSLLIGSCRTSSPSSTKDYLISCREAQARADAGGVLANLFSYVIDVFSLVPVVGTAVDVIDKTLPDGFSPTEFVSNSLKGDGCDTTAAKLDYFFHLTENRLSDLANLIDQNREGSAGRDAVALNSRIRSATISLDDSFEALLADPSRAGSGPISETHIITAKQALTELSASYSSLTDQIKNFNDITFMSLTFTGAVPAGIFALVKGHGVVAELSKYKDRIPNKVVYAQIGQHLQHFYNSFNTYLYIVENKKRNYPGVEFFVKNYPPKATVTPEANRMCSSQTDFKLRYNDELMQYEVRVFGRVLAQKYKDFSGTDLSLNLGQIYPTCYYVDDHPAYERSVTEAVRKDLKADYLDKVQQLYDDIRITDLEALRTKFQWVPAPGLVPSYFDGFSKDIAWGSPDRGSAYDDEIRLPTNKRIQMRRVEIYTGDRVNRICLYIKDGPEMCHGGKGGNLQFIDLADGDYVSHVEVASKTLKQRPAFSVATNETRLFGIKIRTAQGKEIRGGNWIDTAQWTFIPPAAPLGAEPIQIVGLHGGAGKEVDSLGVIYGHAQSKLTVK